MRQRVQLGGGVPVYHGYQPQLPDRDKISGWGRKTEQLTKQQGTHDLLALLNTCFDLGDISLGFIIDFLDLVFPEDLERLPC